MSQSTRDPVVLAYNHLQENGTIELSALMWYAGLSQADQVSRRLFIQSIHNHPQMHLDDCGIVRLRTKESAIDINRLSMGEYNLLCKDQHAANVCKYHFGLHRYNYTEVTHLPQGKVMLRIELKGGQTVESFEKLVEQCEEEYNR